MATWVTTAAKRVRVSIQRQYINLTQAYQQIAVPASARQFVSLLVSRQKIVFEKARQEIALATTYRQVVIAAINLAADSVSEVIVLFTGRSINSKSINGRSIN
jgi:hypothetical protein